MRTNVTRAEFDALGLAGWLLCDGPGPDGAYHLFPDGSEMPPEYVSARLIYDVAGYVNLTFADLQKIAALFETENIDLETGVDGPYSDLTPGMGFEIEIQVRQCPKS